MAPVRRAPDGTPLSLLGMPWELRHQILFELLSLQKNEIISIQRPILIEEYPESTGLQQAAHGLKYHFDLAGFTVLDACPQLYDEGMQVLLNDNHFIAIIGQQDMVEGHLRSHGVHAYLKPESWIGTWDRRRNYFDLGDRIFQPDITIRFKGVEGDGPILLPARHLSAAVFAACVRTHGLKRHPIELTIKSRRGKLWVDRKEERTIEDLRDYLFLWLAKDLALVSTCHAELETAGEKKNAHTISERLRLEVDAVQQLQQDNTSRHAAFFKHLIRFVFRMERFLLAEREEEALKTYQEFVYTCSVFIQRESEYNDSMTNKLLGCLAYAQYRIVALRNAAAAGWEEAAFRTWIMEAALHTSEALYSLVGEEGEWYFRSEARMMRLGILTRYFSYDELGCMFSNLSIFLAPSYLPYDARYLWASDFMRQRFQGTIVGDSAVVEEDLTEDEKEQAQRRVEEEMDFMDLEVARVLGPEGNFASTEWAKL